MKWLLRWCKIYDGIDLLGQIFLTIKNLEEISCYWVVGDNLEKLKAQNIDIDLIKSELSNELKSKIILYWSDYGRLWRSSRWSDVKIILNEQEYS